jgi:hypothetical protein
MYLSDKIYYLKYNVNALMDLSDAKDSREERGGFIQEWVRQK